MAFEDGTPDNRVSVIDTPTQSQKTSRTFVGSPDYRVFIWGVDVTEDVFSVSTNLTIDDQISTATINIVNDNEKWVLPKDFSILDVSKSGLLSVNFHGSMFGGTGSKESKNPTNATVATFAEKKRANILSLNGLTEDFAFAQNLTGPPRPLDSRENAILTQFTNSKSFPYVVGQPIIQSNDPVRIFFKNPWNISLRTVPVQGTTIVSDALHDAVIQTVDLPGPPELEEEWYFGFTGYISTVTEDYDGLSDRSILRITCEDIRKLLRYMRTTTTPNIFKTNTPGVLGLDNITGTKVITGKDLSDTVRKTQDAIRNLGQSHANAGMVLVKTDESRTGDYGAMDIWLFGDNDPSVPDVLKTVGVLGFVPENKIIRQLKGNVGGTIESQMTDILELMYPKLTLNDVNMFGQDFSLGTNNRENRLFVLIPDRGGFDKQKFPWDWKVRVNYFSEFRSRLDIINEFVKLQDCIWYATQKGDIVLEFPQYEFIPQAHDDPWSAILSVQNEWSRFALTQDDRNIKSLTIVQAAFADGVSVLGGPPLAFAIHPNHELIARYGIREQRMEKPFYYSRENSASIDLVAQMWQDLANADANRLQGLESLPNFRLGPGRPIHFRFRDIVGICDFIQHTVIWGQMAQTTYGLRWLRFWDEAKNNYQRLGGNFTFNWDDIKTPEGTRIRTSGSPKDGAGSSPSPFITQSGPNVIDPYIEQFRARGETDVADRLTDLQSSLSGLQPDDPLRGVLTEEIDNIISTNGQSIG